MGGKGFSRSLTLLAAVSLALGVTATVGAARPGAAPGAAGLAGAGSMIMASLGRQRISGAAVNRAARDVTLG